MENKSSTNTYLRSEKNFDQLQKTPKKKSENCFMCDVSIEEIQSFRYWYICVNEYPYDNVAEVHHMLVPTKHVSHETLLGKYAQKELLKILDQINAEGKYDCVIRNFAIGQSYPAHLHYHLIVWKRQK